MVNFQQNLGKIITVVFLICWFMEQIQIPTFSFFLLKSHFLTMPLCECAQVWAGFLCGCAQECKCFFKFSYSAWHRLFLFRPKPKHTEVAIFLFGRNRYQNRKDFSISAETNTETETTEFESFMKLRGV